MAERRPVEDYDSRLRRMVEYIEQDSHEKAEEIDVLAEEEFNMERQKYLDQRVAAVKKYYDKLEDKYQQQILLEISKIKNQSYRDVLGARNVIVEEVVEEMRKRMAHLSYEQSACLYKKVLYQLIVQGLIKIMDPNIVLEVRRKDVDIVKKVLKQAQDYFHSATGMTVQLSVSDVTFLPDKSKGGVKMMNKSATVSLDNTMDAKLDLVVSRIMPHIRKSLFGINPNRLFSD